jgi:1A family penicillin-binding protein
MNTLNTFKQHYRKLVRKYPLLAGKNLAVWAFRAAAAGVLLISFLFIYYSFSLPNPNKLLARQSIESTKILAKDGTLLYEVHGEVNRTLVNLDQIPKDLQNATIAIEDKDFYKHRGISITGLIRSVIVDILSGEKKQGGSTITQQFVKNAVLSRDKAYSRKLKEIILSIEIEAKFKKDDILKLYLNEIPYGRNAYGIEAASRAYFGKSAKELSLAESAYLAAIPQAPTYYNPFGPNKEDLDHRKNLVLSNMRDQGYITAEQYEQAKGQEVAFNKIRSAIIAPHFVFYVQDYLAEKYGERTLQEGGLRVYTTLDPKLQTIAETAVKEELAKGLKYNAHNASLVAIDPKTGQILAMVGSKDFTGDPEPAGCVPGKSCTFEPDVNVSTALRQPGSSFKPFVYATAFKKEQGYAPGSVLFDVVTNFGSGGSNGGDYIPHNFNGNQYGPVSMRKALAGSLNIPAVKTLSLVGVDNAVQTARSLGITSPLKDCGLSLVLGGCEVKLIDHTAAYSVLANGGKRNDKTPILKIEDAKGQVLEEYKQRENQVIDPQAVYQLVNIMTDNSARSYIFGSSSPLILPGRPVAAKTGTTNNFKDGWTMGFTPSLAAGVWAGNNNGDELKADAVQIAGPIWNRFMRDALKDTPVEEFTAPDGINKVTIDTMSGKLPTELSPSTSNETFADYNVPTERDTVHVGVKIDTTTGLPADNNTPSEFVMVKTYTILHSERPDNPNWENPVRAWALANGYEYPPDGSTYTTDLPDDQTPIGERPLIEITSPQEGETITSNSFTVSVKAESDKGIDRVEISIDGDLVRTLNDRPYTTTIKQRLSDGQHTISARAIDEKGGSNATMVVVTVGENTSSTLNITTPGNNQTINSFPTLITAVSPQSFTSVGFYYQQGGAIKLIGIAAAEDIGSTNEYNVNWMLAPKSGSYQIFARSNTGATSNRITVSIP